MNFLDLKCCPHCGHNEFWVRSQYIGTSIFIYNADTKGMDDFDDFNDRASVIAFCRNCGEYVGDYCDNCGGDNWKALSDKVKKYEQELDKAQKQRRAPSKAKANTKLAEQKKTAKVKPNAEISDELNAVLSEAEKDLQEISERHQQENAIRNKLKRKRGSK